MKLSFILEEFVIGIKDIFTSNLIGIYLHGSAAMGCYQPKRSDVDLLIVVKGQLHKKVKKEIISFVLNLEKMYTHLHLEISVIREMDTNPFVYPTPFEWHYSDYHKAGYIADDNYACENAVDKDLAAHIVVTQQRGICLYGKKISQVFPPIPQKYYIQSIMNDVKDAPQYIGRNPIYHTLNLLRVLYYLRNGSVLSKQEAGQWAMKAAFAPGDKLLVARCLKAYERGTAIYGHEDRDGFVNFASTTLAEIYTALGEKWNK